ncbi:unnamed protein product [Adineta ricciae]|uniref:Uncharacterized protein n=1 Tax=Adineta ricciae TaxID=249248 RepID=A0A815JYG4_ADIRI|nr:unnamed protein product [Adineta ricciae]
MNSVLFKVLVLCLLVVIAKSDTCKCCCPSTGSTTGTCGQTSVSNCTYCTNSLCRSLYTCSISGSSGLTATCSAPLSRYSLMATFAFPLLIYLFNNNKMKS